MALVPGVKEKEASSEKKTETPQKPAEKKTTPETPAQIKIPEGKTMEEIVKELAAREKAKEAKSE